MTSIKDDDAAYRVDVAMKIQMAIDRPSQEALRAAAETIDTARFMNTVPVKWQWEMRSAYSRALRANGAFQI